MSEKAEGATRASLELLYNISREFATALDLRTILQRVVFLSMKTVGALTGSIIVLDNNGAPVESAIIAGGQPMDHTTQRLRVTLDKGLAGWVVRNKEPALVTNTAKDRRWLQQKYEDQVESVAKSAVSAPLMVRDRLVGVMTLTHNNPGFFTEEHLSLVQSIADQAAISVLNARLYEESQHQARVMTALAESAAIITSSLNQEEVLNRVLVQVKRALNCEAAAIALVEPGTDELVFRAELGWKHKSALDSRLAAGAGIVGWAMKEGKVAVVHDARLDPRFTPDEERRIGLMISAIAAAPIRSGDQIIGVMEVINPPGNTFDHDTALVMNGISSLAGTAIRHAQLFEKMQSAHRRYRQLFEDSIDSILISDRHGQIIEANRQAQITTGFDHSALLSMQMSQLIQPWSGGSLDMSHARNENGQSYEARLHTGSGTEAPVDVIVHEVDIEDAPCLQWILRDISVRKSLDQLRDDLTAMIYHDLQSPLSNVVSSLEVAEVLVNPEDADMKQLIGIASRSTERIQRLINSLLDINRLEAGQPVGVRQKMDPVVLLKEAIEIMMPTSHGKGQQVLIDRSLSLPDIQADPDMIRRVMINLLENAIKYTPSGSSIEIGGSNDEQFVTLWIKDNGPGIPAADQARIFDKYTRLTGTGPAKGLGLGLAFCRLAVEAHGGRIWIESKPGAGSKFSFTTPIFQPEDI